MSATARTPAKQKARQLAKYLRGERPDYTYLKEVFRCLRAELLESPGMPLDETLEIMQTLDRIRAEWGLVYPTE